MKRTQIYLDEDTYEFLRKESEMKRLSISEVIRAGIRDKMNRKVQKILKATGRVSGIWGDRALDVERHIRTLRKDRKAW
ncbi:MAG TPA: ribbon-helix-helix protein, CopG family [Thermodesulfovibrionales bacterium]|nr:ribbon-helix-helix protein, CopG family [Thermodesulfovibrionales bacterium]